MTKSRARKLAARAYAAQHGVSYTHDARLLDDERAEKQLWHGTGLGNHEYARERLCAGTSTAGDPGSDLPEASTSR